MAYCFKINRNFCFYIHLRVDEGVGDRRRVCVRACVCVCARGNEKKENGCRSVGERVGGRVRERERDSDRERKRESVYVCVCERERKRQRDTERERETTNMHVDMYAHLSVAGWQAFIACLHRRRR